MENKTFIVQWRYESSLGGPWEPGERLTLDDALAQAVNRDSPGVLVVEVAEVAAESRSTPDSTPEAREVSAPPRDRMKRSGKSRGVEDPITKKTFHAVKGG